MARFISILLPLCLLPVRPALTTAIRRQDFWIMTIMEDSLLMHSVWINRRWIATLARLCRTWQGRDWETFPCLWMDNRRHREKLPTGVIMPTKVTTIPLDRNTGTLHPRQVVMPRLYHLTTTLVVTLEEDLWMDSESVRTGQRLRNRLIRLHHPFRHLLHPQLGDCREA